MNTRKVKKIVGGQKAIDGAGVHLTRVIGHQDVHDFDPFLMLDAFDSKNPADYIKGFPWHPHRGIETVTYLISGDIEHGDSLGNKGVINDGSCQWMTAGSGIVHQEMPRACEHMLGAQLWINLPKKHKMTAPAYRDIRPGMIPVVEDGPARVAVVAGEYKNMKAPTEDKFVKTLYLDVALKPEAEWTLETNAKDTLFIYIVGGGVSVDGKPYEDKRALLFSEGEMLKLKAGGEGARFLLFSAAPLKESIAWGGPIVMNTHEELEEAFAELDHGTFIKHPRP